MFTDCHKYSMSYMFSIIYGLLKSFGEGVIGTLVVLTIWYTVHCIYNKDAIHPHATSRSGRRTIHRNGVPAPQTTSNLPRRQRAGPPIALAAGTDSLSIVVGGRSSISDPDVDSKEELRHLCDVVNSRGGIAVEIELQQGGLNPRGFHVLGDHVAALAASISPARWEDFTIRLPAGVPAMPDTEHDEDTVTIETGHLQRLFWTGHREHLTKSFFPFTKTSIEHLTYLALQSTISTHDCERLLIACPNLTDFMVEGLGDVEDVLVHLRRSDTLTLGLRRLARLNMSSTVNINALLRNFKYPVLKEIDLILDYPNALPQDLPWKDCPQIAIVRIRARGMTFQDSDDVKGECPAGIHHDHSW
ncbi:hypothetical protein Hypma_005005 [Hypsizygus marmoreus]|uniref:F-box domain-containing protein n=1 Tax=Hypsizygus marmoreus TaxID=39966 RepID=A0A369K5L8_HYPMA|nr:hypothetical protein Hypma_005005 [Hypsizygus marmoreus]